MADANQQNPNQQDPNQQAQPAGDQGQQAQAPAPAGDQAQAAPAAPAGDQAQAAPAAAAAGGDQEMTIGKYKVKIVKKDCIGAATCVAVSPGVFKLNGENIAEFVDGPNDTPENIVAAAQGCPTKAIIVTDTESGEQVWPK